MLCWYLHLAAVVVVRHPCGMNQRILKMVDQNVAPYLADSYPEASFVRVAVVRNQGCFWVTGIHQEEFADHFSAYCRLATPVQAEAEVTGLGSTSEHLAKTLDDSCH